MYKVVKADTVRNSNGHFGGGEGGRSRPSRNQGRSEISPPTDWRQRDANANRATNANRAVVNGIKADKLNGNNVSANR